MEPSVFPVSPSTLRTNVQVSVWVASGICTSALPGSQLVCRILEVLPQLLIQPVEADGRGPFAQCSTFLEKNPFGIHVALRIHWSLLFSNNENSYRVSTFDIKVYTVKAVAGNHFIRALLSIVFVSQPKWPFSMSSCGLGCDGVCMHQCGKAPVCQGKFSGCCH